MRKITSENYVEAAVNTESCDYDAISKRMVQPIIIRLDHAGKGLCTEAGEFQDMLKKHIFYGKPLDFVNLMEEIGDVMWYVALAVDVLKKLGVVESFDEVLTLNIEKLAKRYPEKFKEWDALNRNLEGERAILEKKEE